MYALNGKNTGLKIKYYLKFWAVHFLILFLVKNFNVFSIRFSPSVSVKLFVRSAECILHILSLCVLPRLFIDSVGAYQGSVTTFCFGLSSTEEHWVFFIFICRQYSSSFVGSREFSTVSECTHSVFVHLYCRRTRNDEILGGIRTSRILNTPNTRLRYPPVCSVRTATGAVTVLRSQYDLLTPHLTHTPIDRFQTRGSYSP